MSFNCPYLEPKCRGAACGNFNDPKSKFFKADKPAGCMGDNPTAQWARNYIKQFGNHNNEDNNNE